MDRDSGSNGVATLERAVAPPPTLTCVHWWRIPTPEPSGPYANLELPGRCRKCGGRRTFSLASIYLSEAELRRGQPDPLRRADSMTLGRSGMFLRHRHNNERCRMCGHRRGLERNGECAAFIGGRGKRCGCKGEVAAAGVRAAPAGDGALVGAAIGGEEAGVVPA